MQIWNRPSSLMMFRVGASVALSLLFFGCVSEEDAENAPPELPQAAPPEVGELSQAILNGNTPDSETMSKGGYVALSYRKADGSILFHCSGALYTNGLLITAKHCVNSGNAAFLRTNPSALTVWLGRDSNNTQFKQGRRIWFPNSDNDYALIEVANPFLMPRNSDGVLSTAGYSRGFGTLANNSSVVCFGAGYNVQSCSADGKTCTGSGNGTLRWATLTAQVVNVGSGGIVHMMARYNPNASNQLQAEGDSGGACVLAPRVFISMWKQPILSINQSCRPGAECFAELGSNVMNESWTLQ